MLNRLIVAGVVGMCAMCPPAQATFSIAISAAILQDQGGTTTGTNAIALLVADTSGLDLGGLTNLAANSSLAVGTFLTDTNGTSVAQVLGRFVISQASETGGQLVDITGSIALNAPLASSQKVWLLWFPSLTSSSTQPGNGTYFGVYRDPATNVFGLADGGDLWVVPGDGSSVEMHVLSPGAGGNTPQTNLVAKYQTLSLDAFGAWQLEYFGCTGCPQAAPTADPDGDGLNNQAEFMAGTVPTNSLSALRILSTVLQSTNVLITWATAGGHTNAVQAAVPGANGSYTNNFADISSPMIISGTGDAITNFVDVSAATNSSSRYYRVRLVP